MSESKNPLIGHWKCVSNRIRQEDGTWIDEKIEGGGISFSPTGYMLLFVRTDQGPWGFSARYQISKPNELTFHVESSMAEDHEDTQLKRHFRFETADRVIYGGLESHTGRIFETLFTRV